MNEEFWVVGGRYRDVSFVDIAEGGAEAYGPFASYEAAMRVWSDRSDRTRAMAAMRYSIVATARRGAHAPPRPAVAVG